MTNFVYTPEVREMSSADATDLYNWDISGWEIGKEVQFGLVDPRQKLRVEATKYKFKDGTLDWSIFQFPNLDPDIEGMAVPIAFGKVSRARAYLVDSTTGQFIVHAGAVKSFLGFEMSDASLAVDSYDTATGSFIYAAYDLETKPTIYVSFLAYYNNPVDCIEQLLLLSGVPSDLIHYPGSADSDVGRGFGTYGARTKYIRGTYASGPYTGEEAALYAVGVYITDTGDVLDKIEAVAAAAGLLFYVNAAGLYTSRAWDSFQADDFLRLEQEKGELLQLEPEAEAEDAVTRVVIRYDMAGEGAPQASYVKESEEWRRRRKLGSHALLDWETPLYLRQDAILLASRTLAMRGPPLRTYKATVSRKALALEPGDGVWLVWPDQNLDHPFEVLGFSYQPGSPTVELMLGDWRGLRESAGFWVDSQWYAPSEYGGSLMDTWQDGSAGWNEEETRYAQTNVGYWTTANGFADVTEADDDSRLYSCWI